MSTYVSDTLYSSAETVAILMRTLGPAREWSTLLADMRRGKNDLGGLVLLPVGRAKTGRSLRPYYRKKDVDRFVADAIARGFSVPTVGFGQNFFFEEPGPTTGAWKKRSLMAQT